MCQPTYPRSSANKFKYNQMINQIDDEDQVNINVKS